MKRKRSVRFLSICMTMIFLVFPVAAHASDSPSAEPGKMTAEVEEIVQSYLENIAEHPTAFLLEEFDEGVL